MTTGARRALAGRGIGQEPGFRWRGGEISRVEGFSDAVFAFAVTLLVVSLEVPRTFHELATAMRGFVVFAVCFALLIVVWREHYVFFRRYGLQDNATIWLNAALLFVVLFYVYPLKFLFTLVVTELLHFSPHAAHAVSSEAMIEPGQISTLFVIYGSGIVAIYTLLALLYVHALHQREALALTPLETFDTRASIVAHLLAAGVGLISITIALTVPPRLVGLAGYAYFLFAPVMTVNGMIAGSRRRRLEGAPS